MTSRPEIDPPSSTRFYDRPVLYDWLHANDTAWEMGFLRRVAEKHLAPSLLAARKRHRASATWPSLCWLEPACGTGRFLRYLARHGEQVTGYDLNLPSLTYARRAFQRDTLPGELLEADMTSFVRRAAFDVAFNLINSFRHLPDANDALKHLRLTARSLKPGGIYVLGIDLVEYDVPEPMEATWSARDGRGREIRHIMITDPPTPAVHRERIMNYFTVTRTDGRELTFESTYDLKTYDLDEWMALLEETPFEIEGTYTFSHQATVLNAQSRDVNFVLRKPD